MKYYHIQICENVSNLFTIIIPREKYHYKRLPVGVANSPEILQQKINDLFHGFEFICAYIYKLLIITAVDWTYHVQKLT